MGTKRQIASAVSAALYDCKDGPVLDLFAGMCSVAEAVAPQRQVWCNDLQFFSQLVALGQFCLPVRAESMLAVAEESWGAFARHREFLSSLHRSAIDEEKAALDSKDLQLLCSIFERYIAAANVEARATANYDLFTCRYAATFFSLEQCIEIDSIKYAIDELRPKYNSDYVYTWMMISLAVACSRCASSPGHFAQPLFPKKNNLSRLASQRRRSIWAEWLKAFAEPRFVGTKRWREKNKSFRADAHGTLKQVAAMRSRPAVIYADPPYTKDQYSRYYHVLESLVLYDYPNARGRGLYRDDRSTSIFCLAKSIEEAFDELFREAAALKCDMVLSYPTNGLLEASRKRLPSMMRRHFGFRPQIKEISHSHSTMGASKGASRSQVTEVLYRMTRQ